MFQWTNASTGCAMHRRTASGRRALHGPWSLIKCATTHWAAHQGSTIGAALAFYCAFSLAPLLIIVVTVTGWIVGSEMAYGQLSHQLTSLFGTGTASILLKAMESSKVPTVRRQLSSASLRCSSEPRPYSPHSRRPWN